MKVKIFFVTNFLLIILCLLNGHTFGQHRVQYLSEYEINSEGKTEKVKLTLILPQNISNVQQVDTIIYSTNPTRFFEHNGDRFAEFEIDSISENSTIQILVVIDLWANDFSMPKNKVIQDSIYSFLSPEKYIESDHDLIVQQALKLKNKKSDLKTVRSIHAFVNKNVKYSGYNPKDVGALSALHHKNGDCTEFADLFVALCRANKIPARVVEGYKTKNITMPQHNWAEVFIPEFGWRMVDPTMSSFAQLDNAYIKLSNNRTITTFNGYHFFSYVYWGDPIKVTDKITATNVF